MFSFVEKATESEKVRYWRALRWFAESISCDNLCDRMMKLFVALEVLCRAVKIGKIVGNIGAELKLMV